MKQTFLFIALVLHIHLFAQTDNNISVISVEKANILYRGIQNPIKIAVPGAISYTISAPGTLKKIDSIGNYLYNVTGVSGREIKFNIDYLMPDSTKIHEHKIFEIRELKTPKASIKQQCCSSCIIEVTKKELAIYQLELEIDDLAITHKYPQIDSFTITLPNKKTIRVIGNSFSPESLSEINKLKIGSVIYIDDIRYSLPISKNVDLSPVEALKLMIVDELKE